MSIVELCYEGKMRVKGTAPGSQGSFHTDVPKELGGLGEYPSPTDLLMGSLGACMLTMMGLRAQKLHVNLEGTTIQVEKEVTHKHQISKLTIRVKCPVPLDAYTTAELEKAAYQCPIHNSLDPQIKKEHFFEWGK